MVDVIIIGAGAAGLEAARHLGRAGLRYRILEASDGVGGRARGAGRHPEIELGAEFIHGSAPTTKRRLARYGQGFRAVDPDFHVFAAERLRRTPEYWTILGRAFSHLRKHREDRPFSEFLETARLTPPERKLASAFIEGFDAAELDRAGANELVDIRKMIADPAERAMARPDLGYSTLLRAMAKPAEKFLRLRTIVNAVEWKPGSVIVRTDGIQGRRAYRARAALVTVPIGVLKALPPAPGAIRFLPEVPGLAGALARIEMGEVVRLSLEFAPEALEIFRAKFRDGFPFIASPELEFMTWWSRESADRHVITAWAGGDHVKKLAGRDPAARVGIALENLSRIIGVRPSTLAHALRQAHQHDWSQDPFARGAYSYLGVDGAGGPGTLRRSVRKTLYFAGEALASESGGTVEAALVSGKNQARKIVATLGMKKAGSATRRSRPESFLFP